MTRAIKIRWIIVVIFALAMAWVESAVVFYLRSMIGRLEPFQPNPLPAIGSFGRVELIREAATLIMLLSVGLLAGRSWRSRLGFAAVGFGIWDIAYYAFMKLICGWPHSLLDWDILFLIPLPWWGPVVAPMSIAALMVLWGTLAATIDAPPRASWAWKNSFAGFVGMFLALYVFMADAIRASPQGEEAVRNVLPMRFNWPWFVMGLLLMAAPLIGMFPAIGSLRPPRTHWVRIAGAWSRDGRWSLSGNPPIKVKRPDG